MARSGKLLFGVIQKGFTSDFVLKCKFPYSLNSWTQICRYSNSSVFSRVKAFLPPATSLFTVKKYSVLKSLDNGKKILQSKARNSKDFSNLKLLLGNQTFSVRNGTGSRGTFPHPTEVPIATIGANCHLDPHRNSGWASELLITLDPNMRHQLFDALREYESMVWTPGKEAELEKKRLEEQAIQAAQAKRLPVKDLRQLALFSALPFVGFGTLDNLIMISAGEYIDSTFGAMLGISTMAAAAIGNMVSDVVGLGTAGYVEDVSRKMGMNPPKMSPIQYDLTSTKLTMNLGRVVGVLIGCTIGMLPLLLKRDESEESENESESISASDIVQEAADQAVDSSKVKDGIAAATSS